MDFVSTYGFDVDRHTIMLGLTGSHAYGMAREGSDVDIRGICIAPRDIRLSAFKSFEQWTTTEQFGAWGMHSAAESLDALGKRGLPVEDALDVQVYELAKFIRLSAQNNPNVLELLFLDEEDEPV